MASFIARMPSDDWRDRFNAGVFGSHTRNPFPDDFKDFVRDHLHSSISSSSSAAAQRRESRILDRWAARQAREMITTIERQAYEAELCELSTNLQPVSTRAASFLRENSPAQSDCSGGSGSIDLPPNVRASSLIQMWRELEAEAGLSPTYRNGTCNSGISINAASSAEEPSGSSDAFDDSDAYGDWESDLVAPIEPAYFSLAESERGRVGDIVRMLNRTQSSVTSWSDETELLGRDHCVNDHGEVLGGLGSSGGTLMRVRGRRVMEDLLARIEQERQMELAILVERRPVSDFSHRGRIQSLLKLKSLRREVEVQDQPRPASTALELDQLQTGATIIFLRERFSHGEQHYGSTVQIMENSISFHAQLLNNSEESDFPGATQFTSENSQYNQVESPIDPESMPPDLNSPQSRSDDLQEGSQSFDVAWEDRSALVSNLDLQRPADSSNLQGPQGEVATEELGTYGQQHADGAWISDPSHQWSDWEGSQQATYRDLPDNFSDNVEIRELLERRRVSTSLASGFRERMERLILSFLRTHDQHSSDGSIAEEDEEQPVWRLNYETSNAAQVASTSSLVPLPCPTFQQPDTWHSSSFQDHSSHQLEERDVIHDLRSDMGQIHREICELRALVESCMERQSKLQHFIKHEVSTTVCQSGDTSSCSEWVPIKGGSCCICYEMQVDSLLYRCGHMCTCFKCAHELQWSSGRCPICRAPIVDVVRAYSNS